MRIGIIDRWLDNWHTNHYPEYIRLSSSLNGMDAELVAVWAECDAPDGGMTTDAWCSAQHLQRAATESELLSGVDAVMVMCADDCLPHEQLAQAALASGKPVYCDKTFAPDLAAATRMFDRAEAHGTPLFSCSAQRFCMELMGYLDRRQGTTSFCATSGPGDMVNYSIHQFEMLQAVMGAGASRCMGFTTEGVRHLAYDYKEGRLATFTQGPKFPFSLTVSEGMTYSRNIMISDYYMNFMQAMLRFFQTGTPPVARADTLEIMAMQEAGRKALASPGFWISLL